MRPLDALRLSPLYHPLRPIAQRLEMPLWVARGRPWPVPHLVKQRAVRAYAGRYGCEVLVETGTYLGSMAMEMRRRFRAVHTIELDPALASRARRLFRGDPRVTVWEGDSAAVLPRVLGLLDGRALFWLDAHHSGGFTARGALETPLRAELACVLSRPGDDVVLIDDAHELGRNDYPSLDEVRAAVAGARPRAAVEVADGIVRISGR